MNKCSDGKQEYKIEVYDGEKNLAKLKNVTDLYRTLELIHQIYNNYTLELIIFYGGNELTLHNNIPVEKTYLDDITITGKYKTDQIFEKFHISFDDYMDFHKILRKRIYVEAK